MTVSAACMACGEDGRSGVYLSITGVDGKAHCSLLEELHKERVDAVLAPLGEVLWRPMPDAKESQISVRRLVSQADLATWPQLNAWMATAMIAAHDLFRPIVKALDARVAGPSDDRMDRYTWKPGDVELVAQVEDAP